jgi:TolB protein
MCTTRLVAVILVAAATAAGVSSAAPARVQVPRFAVAEDPDWSPDGKKIAFVASTVPGYTPPRTLYVMNADGSGVRALTGPGFAADWPSWSPDGRRIAFHGGAIGDQSSHGIYVVDADGSGLQRIVRDAIDPAWSPGGKKIAFASCVGECETDSIFTVSPDGTGRHAIAVPVPDAQYCDDYVQPTWSPDGERVAFANTAVGGECGYRIFIGATRGYGASLRVLFEGWYKEPDWALDGHRLALVYDPPYGKHLAIEIYDLRRGALVNKLRRGTHPRWAPDGRTLIFVRGGRSSWDPYDPKLTSQLYIMNADGSHLRQLTRSS